MFIFIAGNRKRLLSASVRTKCQPEGMLEFILNLYVDRSFQKVNEIEYPIHLINRGGVGGGCSWRSSVIDPNKF